MKKNGLLIIVFGIIFLFIIQSAGTLVEAIYISDLMNTNLDEKAVGILFFFTPLLALPFYKKYHRLLTWILFGVLLITRGLTPYLHTTERILASGIGVGTSLSLLFLLISAKPQASRWGSAGLALAVGLSTLLRTAGYGIEYSLTPAGGWVGWALSLILGGLLALPEREGEPATQPGSGLETAQVLGIYLVMTLIYFSFSAPAVIARWTEGNYTWIVGMVSLLSVGWVWVSASRAGLIERVSPRVLLLWNLLFTASLTATLLAQRVPFPPALESPAVVVGAPSWLQQLLPGVMLLLLPVLYLDAAVFLRQGQQPALARQNLVPGILLGSAALIGLIFINIFSNVWGYIEPVSPPFRNTFWLSYFLLSGGASLLAWLTCRGQPASKLPYDSGQPPSFNRAAAVLLGAIFLVTLIYALPTRRVPVDDTGRTTLRVMTFNTQQSTDESGEKSFTAQLALIRKVSPDILALQETDSARISLNNNDYVRYFTEKLGYYAYYGPTTPTGTFGTAILSKYPLLNTRAVFIYSDKDETGVAEAEIEVNGRRFTLYDVHPDSSDPAMLVFAQTLLARSKDKPYVIALGDYNLRDYEEAYKLIDSAYTNAWVSVYPSKISPDGVDMSGKNRIDHIFLSRNLKARSPIYILPPESATDHPVHWADILWDIP